MSSFLEGLQQYLDVLMLYVYIFPPILIKVLAGLVISGFSVSWSNKTIRSHFWFGFGNGINLSSIISGFYVYYLFVINGQNSTFTMHPEDLLLMKLAISSFTFIFGMYATTVYTTQRYLKGFSIGLFIGAFLSGANILLWFLSLFAHHN